MKKLMLAAALLASVTATAEMKIGTIEMMTLVRNHKTYDSNKKLLEETEKDYKRKLDVIRAEVEKIQEEGRKLAEQATSPLLATSAKQKLDKDLNEVQNRYIAAQQQFRAEAARSEQELRALETRLLKGTTEDLRENIEKFAVENGYDFIIDSSAAPFVKREYDVTDGVLKAMGVDPDQVKRGDEGK